MLTYLLTCGLQAALVLLTAASTSAVVFEFLNLISKISTHGTCGVEQRVSADLRVSD
jgi:hypothetical protein